MDKDQILKVLAKFSEKLSESKKEKVELIIAGSVPLILKGELERTSTNDVDAFPMEVVHTLRKQIIAVAEDPGLTSEGINLGINWLNGSIAMFLRQEQAKLFSKVGTIFFDDDHLKVVGLTKEQILAMKLLSDRERDWSDAEYIIQCIEDHDTLKQKLEEITDSYQDEEKTTILSMFEKLSKIANHGS